MRLPIKNGRLVLTEEQQTRWDLPPVPQDVYLFVGAHIGAFQDEITEYYNPYQPTPEGIAVAKKKCKSLRSVCKTVHLAKQYGAGPYKIYYTLLEAGYKFQLEEVKEICQDWDNLFGVTFKFGDKLKKEWTTRGGWCYNLLYRPFAVDEDKLKDLTNRYCQSSGHDLLLKFLCYIQMLREERGVEMYPWIVDFHDETMWECPEGQVDAVVQILRDALVLLNDELKDFLVVPIKGDVEVADTLADIKVEG